MKDSMGEGQLWLMLIVLVTLFTTFTASAEENFENTEEILRRYKRIVNGETVREGQWKWLVHLKADVSTGSWWTGRKSRSVKCGGSIVDGRWVLTAAHCLDDTDSGLEGQLQKPREWHITAGEVNWRCSNQVRNWWGRFMGWTSQRCNIHASKIVKHPEYKKGGRYYWANDIALFKLEDNILQKGNTEVLPTCDTSGISGEFPTEGDTGYVHGWGCTSVGGPSSSSAQNAAISIRSNTYCRGSFSGAYNTTAHLCAGGSGSSVCNGDSGGPLVVMDPSVRWCQAGVVLFFTPSQATTRPAGFARVGPSHRWIRNTIQRG